MGIPRSFAFGFWPRPRTAGAQWCRVINIYNTVKNNSHLLTTPSYDINKHLCIVLQPLTSYCTLHVLHDNFQFQMFTYDVNVTWYMILFARLRSPHFAVVMTRYIEISIISNSISIYRIESNRQKISNFSIYRDISINSWNSAWLASREKVRPASY